MVATDKPRHFSRLARGPIESGLEYMSVLTHQSDKRTVHRMKQGFFFVVWDAELQERLHPSIDMASCLSLVES